jgi:hypothetical protein
MTHETKQEQVEAPASRRFCDEELVRLLEAEPVLCHLLREALAGGRWLVTVHRKVKDAPPADLMHGHVIREYPVTEIVNSLQHIAGAILEQEQQKLRAEQGKAGDRNRWR